MKDDLQVAAPPLISAHDFTIVADLLKQMTGIYLGSNKRAMVSGRLSKRLKAVGIASINVYCEWLQQPGNVSERDAFISALTTNMTRFNREDHHFKHLAMHILPRLATAARSGQRVRLWSAACSTGEEAYDIAFRVLDACPEASELDIRILATDIDKSALETARIGIYPAASLSDLPEGYGDRYMDYEAGASGMVRVTQAARRLITYRCLNLNADWPFHGNFDVIMCRNVTIYFDEETQRLLWHRLADRIEAKGALYIGHSELLPEAIAERFVQQERGAFCRPARVALRGVSPRPVTHGPAAESPDTNGGLT